MLKMNYDSLLCLFLHHSKLQPKNLKLFRHAGGEIPFSRIPATCCFKLFMSLNSFASKTFGHISKNLTELKPPEQIFFRISKSDTWPQDASVEQKRRIQFLHISY